MVKNTLVLLFVDYEILFISNIVMDLRENIGCSCITLNNSSYKKHALSCFQVEFNVVPCENS